LDYIEVNLCLMVNKYLNELNLFLLKIKLILFYIAKVKIKLGIL